MPYPYNYSPTLTQQNYPIYMPQANMAPQMPISGGLIRVTGMDGVNAFQMMPNSRVALFDDAKDVFYIKTTDGAGFPTVKTYGFTELEEDKAPPVEYISRNEFDDFKNSLEEAMKNVEQLVRGGKSRKSADEL